ncbi:MAG: MerR family transcriptional regulator [bacterium]
MNKFSIKDIETITGIKSHTIRVWEQRYNLLQTKRSDTNIRYYDDEDLKFLLNVSILNDSGIKISEIVKMTTTDMTKKVEKLSEVENNFTCHIHSLVKNSLELNELEFKKSLVQSVKKMGFEQTMIQVIYPFLHKVGIMWQTGMINPAQEHFATNLIKQRLILAIDSVKPIEVDSPKRFLLFLPENEYHEIALLFAYYVIKQHGHKVLYLGQSLSLAYVNEVIESYRPDYIFSILTNSINNSDLHHSVQSFIDFFPNQTILLAGSAMKEYKIKETDNLVNLQDVADLLSFLNQVDMTYASVS